MIDSKKGLEWPTTILGRLLLLLIFLIAAAFLAYLIVSGTLFGLVKNFFDKFSFS